MLNSDEAKLSEECRNGLTKESNEDFFLSLTKSNIELNLKNDKAAICKKIK